MKLVKSLIALIGALVAMPAHATTYDAFSSFNGMQGAGNFNYFGLTGQPAPNAAVLFNTNLGCLAGLTCLQLSGVDGGAAFYKSTLPPFIPDGTTITVPNDMLIAVPDQYGVFVNFIAPATATYNISASFTGLDSLANGVGIFAIAPVNQATPVITPNTVPNNATYTRSLVLGKGQGFAFVVAPGMVASHDVTGFNFTVSTVPEPMTWAMMIVGIGLVGGAMRRQRRTVRYTFA